MRPRAHRAAARRDGSILSLQNGLNAEAIGKNVGADRVLLALVNFASDYIEPA